MRSWRRSGWFWLVSVALILGAQLALLGQHAAAHSGHHRPLFVAADGRDEGDCLNFSQPCRTIRYAINQAGAQGSTVWVAEGEYSFEARELVLLLSNQVPVRGGYSRSDMFVQQNMLAHPTLIRGIPAAYRPQLNAHGFVRAEDVYGIEDPSTITPGMAPEASLLPQLAGGIIDGPVACQSGVALVQGTSYECSGIDFLSQVPLPEFKTATEPSGATDGSNLWGHIDLNTGREYAVIGVSTGTGVVDMHDPTHPVLIGTVPGKNSIWREVKVYQFWNEQAQRWNAYAYISTESTNGLQIVDLNNLPQSVSLAATISSDFTTSHTVYISNLDMRTNTPLPGATPILYMNGTNRSGGVFRGYSLANPLSPALLPLPPTISGGMYTHDSTSMRIDDARVAQCAPGHNPCDIYIDYSEHSVELWDVTALPAVHLSSTSYSNDGYVHSGWWSADKRYVFIQDEYDEIQYHHNSQLRTLDISNLLAPKITATWTGPTAAIDHNGYVIDQTYYMSNYRRGVTLLNITAPNSITEKAFFDTFPGSNSANFNGAWGIYPFLPSHTLLVADIERGLVALHETNGPAPALPLVGLGIAGPATTNAGTSALFTAEVQSGNPLTYTWDFGDGTLLEGPAAQAHVYQAPGQYTVRLTATNAYHSLTVSRPVTVEVQENWQLWFPSIIQSLLGQK